MPKLKFKPFQLDHYARAAMRDGVILAHEQGLGKSLAAFAIPLAKRARRVLLVAPGGLHAQLQREGIEKFGVWVTPLNQGNFDKFAFDKPVPVGPGPTRFFLTTYEELGYNGGDEWPAERDADGNILRGAREENRLADSMDVKMMRLSAKLLGEVFNPDLFFNGVGCTNEAGIRCIWTPTLATRIQTCEARGGGFDMVVVDEGTKLQATDSHVSNGVRRLNPKYRLVLTGTPIKNRLESFFWLAQWAAGGSPTPTARWPYPGTSEARCEFADQHLETERYITREDEKRDSDPRWRGRMVKLTPRISNVHKFWKLAAPIMLRLRKEDCGESIVPKTIKPVQLQIGEKQQEVYRYFVENPPVATNEGQPIFGRTSIGMQLGLLRMASLCPHAPGLGRARCDNLGVQQSDTEWNPKMAACLSLVHEILAKDEQVVIGSPFTEFSVALHAKLKEAGVDSLLLDGSVSPKKRGEMAQEFKKGRYRVLVAGLKSMGEGHSFECANHLILPSLSWALDDNLQFIHRVWRLTSTKPVTIYPLTIPGTIDDKMLELFTQKSDAAALALDGALQAEQVEELDMAQLLAEVLSGYRPTDATVSEDDMERRWPAMAAKLRAISGTTNEARRMAA